MAVSWGYAEVTPNKVDPCRAAEVAAEIDIERAKAAMEKAERSSEAVERGQGLSD